MDELTGEVLAIFQTLDSDQKEAATRAIVEILINQELGSSEQYQESSACSL